MLVRKGNRASIFGIDGFACSLQLICLLLGIDGEHRDIK